MEILTGMPRTDFSAWLTSPPEPILKIVQKKRDAKKKREEMERVSRRKRHQG